MVQREYEITIGADGSVEVYVKGFKGKGCLAAAKFFEEIVGEVNSTRMTSEFYEPDEEVRYDVEQRH